MVEGVLRPASVPKGRTSISTFHQADWKLDPRVAAFKVCKYILFCGTAFVNPTGLQTRRSGDILWAKL